MWTQDERMDQDERKKDVAGKSKPIPIREAVGESGPRPSQKSDGAVNLPTSRAPGLRGQRERPEGPRGKEREHVCEPAFEAHKNR